MVICDAFKLNAFFKFKKVLITVIITAFIIFGSAIICEWAKLSAIIQDAGPKIVINSINYNFL